MKRVYAIVIPTILCSLFLCAVASAQFYQASSGPLSYAALLKAARAAQSGVSKDCYRTSARTAQINGGISDGWSWAEDTTHRGKSLRSGLAAGMKDGRLKPGMIVYCNRRPGTDPASVNLSNLPHWFTYLGKDRWGTDRFSDQYACDFDLSGPRGIAATYAGRVIDAFFEPYPNRKSLEGRATVAVATSGSSANEAPVSTASQEGSNTNGAAPGSQANEALPTTAPGTINLLNIGSIVADAPASGNMQIPQVAQRSDNTASIPQSDAEVVMGSAPTGFFQPATGPLSFLTLLNVATRSRSNIAGDCYITAARTVRLNGGNDDGWSWAEDSTRRGENVLSGLEKAIESGELQPGMVVYACKNPGTDPAGTNSTNLPRWFTYLGKDRNGNDTFSDQYSANLGLSGPNGIAAVCGPNRRIDCILDPYFETRPTSENLNSETEVALLTTD